MSVVSNDGNYQFSLGSDVSGKMFTGGTSADTIIASDGAAVSISGGAGDDSISLGNGAETIISSAGNDTLEGYDATQDVIRFTSEPTSTWSSDGVTLTDSTGTVFVKKSDTSTTGVKVQWKVGTGTPHTIDYFEKAQGEGGVLTLKSATKGSTIDASAYDDYKTIDLADFTGTNLTLKGFTKIQNFNEASHTIEGVPTDAVASGSDLAVTTADGTVTVGDMSDATVNLTSGTTSYTAAIGTITNVTAGTVTLTSNYADSIYAAGNTVKAVDAAAVTKAISLNGSAASNITLLGGDYNDTLIGGTTASSLNGGAGDDYVSLISAATVNVSLGNDTVDVGEAKALTVEGFGAGDVILLKDAVSTLNTAGTNITAGNVTISGLQLESTTTEWQISGKSAAWVETSNGGPGLSNENKQITYQGVTSKTLFTIDGISTITNDALSGTTVTLGKANFAGMSITLIDGTSKDYKLALDGDYTATSTSAIGFEQSVQSATYTGAGKTAGYSLASDAKSCSQSTASAR